VDKYSWLKKAEFFSTCHLVYMPEMAKGRGVLASDKYPQMYLLHCVRFIPAPGVVPPLLELLARHKTAAAQDIRIFEVYIFMPE
jgi:hypothetical protein